MEEKLRSRGLSIRWARILALLWLPLCCVARAETLEDADLHQEIVLRCHYDMGEFGVEGVHLCIEADDAALKSLSEYPAAAKTIVSRCTRQMQVRGWAAVKLCADQDLAAQDALAHYSEEHRAVIERCEAEIGKQGLAKVKACADARIAGKVGTETR